MMGSSQAGVTVEKSVKFTLEQVQFHRESEESEKDNLQRRTMCKAKCAKGERQNGE